MKANVWMGAVLIIETVVLSAALLLGCASQETKTGDPRTDGVYLTPAQVLILEGNFNQLLRAVEERDQYIHELEKAYIQLKKGSCI